MMLFSVNWKVVWGGLKEIVRSLQRFFEKACVYASFYPKMALFSKKPANMQAFSIICVKLGDFLQKACIFAGIFVI